LVGVWLSEGLTDAEHATWQESMMITECTMDLTPGREPPELRNIVFLTVHWYNTHTSKNAYEEGVKTS
jgi:hypothetical protein